VHTVNRTIRLIMIATERVHFASEVLLPKAGVLDDN
jgi:hypothetical protein